MIKLKDIKPNPSNPRVIKGDKFDKLVNSIKEFPKMLELRPMVVNEDNVLLGGNMRLKALQHLKYDEIPETWVKQASELTEDEQRRFIISDNVGYGEWDWEQLANEWNSEELSEWGLEVPMVAPEVDYSILDEEDVSEQLSEMTGGVKKAIQIEFEPDHYEEAYELVKFWRERDAYVGKMILDFLKAEKELL